MLLRLWWWQYRAAADRHYSRVLKSHLQCYMLEAVVVNARPRVLKVKHKGLSCITAGNVEEVLVLAVLIETPVAPAHRHLVGVVVVVCVCVVYGGWLYG